MRHFIFALSLLVLALSTDSSAQPDTNRFILPYFVRDAAFDPLKPRAFVLPDPGVGVELIDLETRASQRIFLNGFPRSLTLSPDGTRLYVNATKTQNSSTIAIFDAQEFKFLREVEVEITGTEMVVTDSGLIIIAGDSEANSHIRIFESAQGRLLGTSGALPRGITLALNQRLGIVYATEESRDGAHHHIAFSETGAITSHWQVPFNEAIFNNRLFIFPHGAQALTASGHALASTTDVQTDLKPTGGDADISFIFAAAFETNQNRIALLAQDKVHFIDAGTLQQLDSRRIPGAQFIAAYGQRTAVIIRAPRDDSRSEIRWLLPKPASASENLPPTALLFPHDSSPIVPVDWTIPVEVHGRDADGEIMSTRVFAGETEISVSSAAVVFGYAKIRPGTNEIYAIVTDEFGAMATSAVHRVYGNYPPQLDYPPLRTSYTNVQPVTIQVYATDRDGEIRSVRLKHGSQVLAEDNTNPYEFIFTAPTPGSFTLNVEAEDNLGATTWLGLPTLTFQGGTDNFGEGLFVHSSSSVSTNLVLSGSNLNATRQKGEPLHAGVEGGKSIWWAWRVPNSAGGIVSIDTIGSDFDTLLAVYSAGPQGTNDITKLNLLAANDDDITHSPASKVKFFAPGSHILYIAVDGREGVAGDVKLRINFAANTTQRPPNDNFLTASTTQVGGTGTNVGATKEPGEMDHAGNPGGASVWWKLNITSGNLRPYRISTTGSRFDTLLAVYTTNFPPRVINATITNLTLVAANDDGNYNTRTSDLTFVPPKPGNYWIAVDGYNGAEGTIALTIFPLSSGAPTNDHFAAALLLTGPSVLTNGQTITATREPNEPLHADKTNSTSVWFKWTAPTNGLVSISTRTSDFDTILAVYKGTNLTSLIPVASNDDDPAHSPTSEVKFYASESTEYFIAVAGFGTSRGEFVLALNQSAGFSPRLQTEWSQGKIVLNSIDAPGTTLLESSTNLVDWEVIDTLSAADTFEVAPSATSPQRFYRLRLIE